jgi:hypothetical protein
MGMDYEMYLPFMLQCGLVRLGRKNLPIVSIAKSHKNGSYIWDEFISEYKLPICVFTKARHKESCLVGPNAMRPSSSEESLERQCCRRFLVKNALHAIQKDWLFSIQIRLNFIQR